MWRPSCFLMKGLDVKPVIAVAVRTLVNFVLRAGDLALVFKGSQQALAGLRAHQKVQQSRSAGYLAEVPIRHALAHDRFGSSGVDQNRF